MKTRALICTLSIEGESHPHSSLHRDPVSCYICNHLRHVVTRAMLVKIYCVRNHDFLQRLSDLYQLMSANVFGAKKFIPTAPDKGSFPLDHEGELCTKKFQNLIMKMCRLI